MLGKLIKHEFKATYKIFGLLFGALMLLTILTRFCIYIPFDNMVFDLLTKILTIVYVIAIVCMSIFSIVIVLIRFNNNMLRDQGYLSHTLPVKMWQQITAKVITYTVWMMASMLAMVISLMVFFVGKDEFRSVLKGINKAINEIGDYPKIIVLIVVGVILMIMQLAANILNAFAALSLGQIFAKHKIAGAILFYFILNYALGFITSGIMMLVPNLVDDMNSLDVKMQNANTLGQVADAMFKPFLSFFIFTMILEVLIGAIYFVITNFMLNKKLNLE